MSPLVEDPHPQTAITLDLGLSPSKLVCQLPTSIDSAQPTIELNNTSPHEFASITITVSYYDAEGQYLDFEDIEWNAIAGLDSAQRSLSLTIPKRAISATIDIVATEQTFIKRHWKLLSTIVIVIWGLIILTRRLGPFPS